MNVGIVCYASVGGSGIVATELAKSLAARGHDVHVLSTDPPFRFGSYQPGLTFHRVPTPAYPLFREPQYVLALATRIVHVAREVGLDILHAHYAVPHATAAYLAKQILSRSEPEHVPRVITTLHGTDITLVGSDPSYSEIVAFSIEQSDAVTAVSENLRGLTYTQLGVRSPIAVIPNFLDCAVHRRVDVTGLRERFAGPDPATRIVVHVSNFRPVKRIDLVMAVFDRIRRRVPAKLLLVGDGPELNNAHRLARERGLSGLVHAVGAQEEVTPLLSISDVFLLPSEQESFGLAGLEAMACGVPVVAARVGGLPEVIEHGVSGFLHPLEASDEMADSAIALLTDREAHARVAAAARRRVEEYYCAERIVPMYEKRYEALLTRTGPAS
jgi:N-acetyl-alpha-D-glucosaminyl L-malate synthase BshA